MAKILPHSWRNPLILHGARAVHALAKQEARPSVTIVLTWFSRNIPITAVEGQIKLRPREFHVCLNQNSMAVILWGRVTHKCVSKLTIIGSDNGLASTDDWILLCRTLGIHFSEILMEINKFSFKKMHLKLSPAKWRLIRLGLNEWLPWDLTMYIYVGDPGHHWVRLWLVACPAPSHYLTQCWIIVSWTFGNKPQWPSDQNTSIFLSRKHIQNAVCKKYA